MSPAPSPWRNDRPAFRIGGLVFGGAYTVVSHHTEEGDGAAGPVVRRGYLTFDADGTRPRTDVNFRLTFSLDFG